MSDRSVLVTGATGFIGRSLVTRLVDLGVPVRCLVRSSSSTAEFNDSLVQLCEGDVLDRGSVRRAADGVEAIFHLAAVVGDWGDPNQFLRVNVDGARNVYESAAELGARVILASSIVVYGETLHTGVCAEDIGHGTAFAWYGRTKQQQELIAAEYADEGLDIVVLRLSNVYGPASRLWVDEAAEYLRRGLPSLVDGGRGDACLLHVDNAVEALILAWQVAGSAGRVYNIADGTSVTWRQYFCDLARLAGCPCPRSMSLPVARAMAAVTEETWRVFRLKKRPPLTREALALVSSIEPLPIERACRELGYRPVVSYEEGMRGVADYLESSNPSFQ